MPEDPLAALEAPMRSWVHERRDHYRPLGQPLSREERGVLSGYFGDELLDRVRVCDVERHVNPEAFEALERSGQPLPFDLREFTGLTLIDTIVLCTPRLGPENPRLSVLFQECVHVCQFGLVELDDFIRSYLRDFAANGFQNAAIAVEREAQELRDRFDASPGRTFSVEGVVRRRLFGGDPAARGAAESRSRAEEGSAWKT